MAQRSEIVFPQSSFPGLYPQEGAGRLINVTAEPLGNGAASKIAHHRQPGLTLHANSGQAGYRGGLLVGNLAYEVFATNVVTVDGGGVVTALGAMGGVSGVSIARDLAAAPNVVAVDPANGAFTLTGGPPAPYTGGGNLPQPNSVAYQDGSFHFTIADGRVFASGINALTQNLNTVTKLQAMADVQLLRAIPFNGLMLYFTTGGFEAWQDAANPFPTFPYSRAVVLPFGLVQPGAIAGYEVGFQDISWVAQDFGVYRMSWGSLTPTKVSPPDLDRLIETQVRAGHTLDANAYAFGGKKFWCLSSPAWSWELNLSTGGWNERWSLQAAIGLQGRWRATYGHPAFGKWLTGDTQSGAIAFHDDTAITELGAPQLCRLESGPVAGFPDRMSIGRADFNFVVGAGVNVAGADNLVNPQLDISWSDDGGVNYLVPVQRGLGAQARGRATRVTVKRCGQATPLGRRWRVDNDSGRTSLMSAFQSQSQDEY